MTKRGRFDYAAVPVVPEKSAETVQPEEQKATEVQKNDRKPAKRAVKTTPAVPKVQAEQPKQGLPSKRAAMTVLLADPDSLRLPPQRRGRPDLAAEGRMAIQREQLNVRVLPELKRSAAAVGALQGLTLGDVVEAALIDYIQRHS